LVVARLSALNSSDVCQVGFFGVRKRRAGRPSTLLAKATQMTTGVSWAGVIVETSAGAGHR
jgi:hypothetical protein